MELHYKRSKRAWRMILHLYLNSSKIKKLYAVQTILLVVICLSAIYRNYVAVLDYSFLFLLLTSIGFSSIYFSMLKKIKKDYSKIVFTPDELYIDDAKLQYSEIECSLEKNNEVLIEVNGQILIASIDSKSHNFLKIAHFMAYNIEKMN